MDQLVNGRIDTTVLLIQAGGAWARQVALAFQSAGIRVLGPVASAAEVERLLDAGGIGHAVVDLGLGEALGHEVAALLASRRIPWMVLGGGAGSGGSREDATPAGNRAQAAS